MSWLQLGQRNNTHVNDVAPLLRQLRKCPVLRPEGQAFHSPGRSEAEAWVSYGTHGVLKGRHFFHERAPCVRRRDIKDKGPKGHKGRKGL